MKRSCKIFCTFVALQINFTPIVCFADRVERGPKIYTPKFYLAINNDWIPPQNGRWIELYKNGKKCFETQTREGKPHGLFTAWDDNGRKAAEGNFIDGHEDGPWVNWHENGGKQRAGNYREGLPDGIWIGWHENGNKKFECNFKKGILHGQKTWWNKNGQKVFDAGYFDGKKDGPYARWYENGEKQKEGTYSGGKIITLTVWKPDGKEDSTSSVKDGAGAYTDWQMNGERLSRTTIKDGVMDGRFIAWDDKGRIKEKGDYKNGEKDGIWITGTGKNKRRVKHKAKISDTAKTDKSQLATNHDTTANSSDKNTKEGSKEKHRTWTNKTGTHKTKAVFVELAEDKTVTLKRQSDGKLLKMALSKLSTRDQRYIKNLTAKKSTPAKREAGTGKIADDSRSETSGTKPLSKNTANSMREWSDKTGGHKIKGTFEGTEKDGSGVKQRFVKIKIPDESVIRVKISDLSRGDRDFLHDYYAEKAKITVPINLQVVNGRLVLNDKALPQNYDSLDVHELFGKSRHQKRKEINSRSYVAGGPITSVQQMAIVTGNAMISTRGFAWDDLGISTGTGINKGGTLLVSLVGDPSTGKKPFPGVFTVDNFKIEKNTSLEEVKRKFKATKHNRGSSLEKGEIWEMRSGNTLVKLYKDMNAGPFKPLQWKFISIAFQK